MVELVIGLLDISLKSLYFIGNSTILQERNLEITRKKLRNCGVIAPLF